MSVRVLAVVGLTTALAWPLATRLAAQGAGKPVAATVKSAVPANAQTAVFAGGCFWCVEADFDKIDGVLSTTSGYTDGHVPMPSYELVSSGSTGHTEAVRVVFDPTKVTYRQLVDYFWRTIDPTVKDRQFCDVGTPYRTGIYPLDDAQWRDAQASKAAIEKSKPFADPIVTEIKRATPFYEAEAYHQDYYRVNPVRYTYYRNGCGRDQRLKALWGATPKAH